MYYRTSPGLLARCLTICLFFTIFAAPALGGVERYSSMVANYEVKYDDVFEAPDPIIPLFQPLGFQAESVAANPSIDLLEGSLVVTAVPLPGAVFDTITFKEGGNYKLGGAVGQTSEAYATAMLFVDSYVFVNIKGLLPRKVVLDKQIVTFERQPTFSPSSQSYLDRDHWSLICVVDISDALAAAGVDREEVISYEFSINNTLMASSELISSAFIEKTDFSFEDDACVLIPEPSLLALLLAGCCIVVVRRRK